MNLDCTRRIDYPASKAGATYDNKISKKVKVNTYVASASTTKTPRAKGVSEVQGSAHLDPSIPFQSVSSTN